MRSIHIPEAATNGSAKAWASRPEVQSDIREGLNEGVHIDMPGAVVAHVRCALERAGFTDVFFRTDEKGLILAEPPHAREHVDENVLDDEQAFRQALDFFWHRYAGWYTAAHVQRHEWNMHIQRRSMRSPDEEHGLTAEMQLSAMVRHFGDALRNIPDVWDVRSLVGMPSEDLRRIGYAYLDDEYTFRENAGDNVVIGNAGSLAEFDEGVELQTTHGGRLIFFDVTVGHLRGKHGSFDRRKERLFMPDMRDRVWHFPVRIAPFHPDDQKILPVVSNGVKISSIEALMDMHNAQNEAMMRYPLPEKQYEHYHLAIGAMARPHLEKFM